VAGYSLDGHLPSIEAADDLIADLDQALKAVG
jgi:hypothetical protein